MPRVLLVLIFLFTLNAAAKRGATPEDYFAFENISDPRISPDGHSVAYVLGTVDSKKNRRVTSIWLVPASGSAGPRRLTLEGASASAPRWSPDGTRLAFLSTRGEDGGRPQIFVLPMEGGEARQLTHLKNGVQSFQWSPQGERFAVVSQSGIYDNVAPADRKSDVRHYKTISYKFNDSGWFDDKRSHIWTVSPTDGAEKQLTSGDDWNDADPQWSPDGTRIAFVSDRTGKEYEDGDNRDIWVIPAAGGNLLKISDHDFDDTQPRWSPDGTQIAFAGQRTKREHPKLFLASANGGASRIAADGLDLIPAELNWSSPRELRFQTGTKGQLHIFKVDLDTRRISALTSGERGVRSFDLNRKSGLMVYLANDFRHLDELFASALDGKDERQLTRLNTKLWSELDLASVERVPYKSTDGWQLDGFLVKPVGYAAGKKYPLILSIHGGPAGQYGTDWYHEFQVYAAKGWGVFFANPRGSTGYGEKFERGIENNWGVMDYQDVMAGLDAVIRQNAWIDTDRLGVTGGSYGGFLTNWIVGHTNRFKAAVTLRSVVNFISDEGTRDGSYGHAEDFKGNLFEHFEQYWEASPLKHAKNVKTPTLILHSDNDFRVPLEQGEQWFRALKHYGVTTELVIFPRENHNLTRTGEPRHLVESLNWQLYWFDKYMMGNTSASPPDAQ